MVDIFLGQAIEGGGPGEVNNGVDNATVRLTNTRVPTIVFTANTGNDHSGNTYFEEMPGNYHERWFGFTNAPGASKLVCVSSDGRLIDGDVFASRPMLKLQPYTRPDGTKSAWALLAYEESKGMGHSLAAEEASLPDCFEISARTPDGEIMGIRHKEHNTEGIQFHPESIMTPVGKRLLRNFITYVDDETKGEQDHV